MQICVCNMIEVKQIKITIYYKIKEVHEITEFWNHIYSVTIDIWLKLDIFKSVNLFSCYHMKQISMETPDSNLSTYSRIIIWNKYQCKLRIIYTYIYIHIYIDNRTQPRVFASSKATQCRKWHQKLSCFLMGLSADLFCNRTRGTFNQIWDIWVKTRATLNAEIPSASKINIRAEGDSVRVKTGKRSLVINMCRRWRPWSNLDSHSYYVFSVIQ